MVLLKCKLLVEKAEKPDPQKMPEMRHPATTTAATAAKPLVKSKSSYGSMRASRASRSGSSSSTSSTSSRDHHHQPLQQQQLPAAHFHSTPLKCVMLLLCSALGLGSNYCYHSPAALKNQLQQHFSAELQKDQFEVLFVSFPLNDLAYSYCCLPV